MQVNERITYSTVVILKERMQIKKGVLVTIKNTSLHHLGLAGWLCACKSIHIHLNLTSHIRYNLI